MNKQRPLIGIIAAEAEFVFFASALEIIQKELFAADMDTAVFSSLMMSGHREFDTAENSVYDLINFGMLDGLIVIPSTISDNEVRDKLAERVRREFSGPVIMLDAHIDGVAESIYNYAPAAELIISHVMDCHGAKTIDLLCGQQDDFHNTIERYFRKAMEKRGYNIPDNRLHRCQDWIDDFSGIADDIIANGLPDAIVCCSDLTAVQLITCLTDRGVKIPEDVIVTGFNKGEPYGAEYLNITSVLRDPGAMSRNAAHYIISKVRGTEYVPESDENSATLSEGITCGCQRLDLSAMCSKAASDMTSIQRNGFDSYYNFMSEDLISAETFYDYLWKADWFTHFLGDFSGFWMCLNDKVMHNAAPDPGFTEKICIPYCRVNNAGKVDLMQRFPREQMLPAIFEQRERPAGYIFTSLHFMGVNYGYVVLSYGDSGKVYDQTYVKWLRSVTCALEKHRRHIIYNDAVTESQVRDSLTGLLNMRGYTRIMTERCGKFNDPSRLLRIISIDIENLKGINDTYGYAEGDKVISGLAVALTSAAGENDIVVRVSGDEFFIAGIIEEGSVDDVPSRLQSAMESLNHRDNREYGVNIYTAAVTAPLTDKTLLEKLPYEAAYQRTLAKDNHTKMHKTADVSSESFDPEERLNVIRLLNENLFTYHFQPIVNARNGRIYAYEALMRSGDEFRLSPLTILSHAEALERLDDVERHTMFNVFRFVKENQPLLNGKLMFVNSIPACSLSDSDFEKLYHLYGDIMPKMVVEFTEQTQANENQLNSLLDRSQRCGFKIAIDDYGTGYSNISSLLNFMPNVVKIDRSLIMNIHKDKRKKHFTRNIIEYAHDNHFMALAEGVELTEELQTVIAMGVDLIQGYYTAKPSPDIQLEINPEIVQEIQDYNRQSEVKRVRKTYFTGDEKEVSLMALDLDSYTDIIINKPEYTLTGNKNYVSEMLVRVKDNTDCRLDLVDISMKNESAGASVTVGQNSTLTLNIIGEVSISGGIYVPAGSTLKIIGDGSLTISSCSNQTYAIGSGTTMPYGNIEIDLNSRLYIHLDSEKSVAIGGRSGDGSHISICCKELVIEQMGKQSLSIGSLLSGADITVHDTRLSFEHHSKNALAMGSFSDPCNIEITSCSSNFNLSGDKIGGFGSFNSCGGSVKMTDVSVNSVFKGKEILGIGADKEFGEIVMTDCTFNAVIEGAEAVVFGSEDCEGTLSMTTCSGDIIVRSGAKTLLGVKPENLISDRCGLKFDS